MTFILEAELYSITPCAFIFNLTVDEAHTNFELIVNQKLSDEGIEWCKEVNMEPPLIEAITKKVPCNNDFKETLGVAMSDTFEAKLIFANKDEAMLFKLRWL